MDKNQFNRKQWKAIQSDKTWSIFKIMSEFVEGFEKLSNIDHVYLFLVLLGQNQIINTINMP